MSAANNLLDRARANLVEAGGILALQERLAAITLAVANESVQASRLAIRAASKVPAARARVTQAERELADAEREASRLEREERLQRERAASPPLTDEERRQLVALAPERLSGKGLIPIPGISIECLQDAQLQSDVGEGDRFVERPATGARAYELRQLLRLFASKFLSLIHI